MALEADDMFYKWGTSASRTVADDSNQSLAMAGPDRSLSFSSQDSAVTNHLADRTDRSPQRMIGLQSSHQLGKVNGSYDA